MASSKKGEDGVVPVVFNMTTKYGRKGEFGYIPESFADAWLEKGVVLSAAKVAADEEKKSSKKVSKKKVEEVPDEVSSEGESAEVGPDGNESVSDGAGESA